jgi:hypothetical protein
MCHHQLERLIVGGVDGHLHPALTQQTSAASSFGRRLAQHRELDDDNHDDTHCL